MTADVFAVLPEQDLRELTEDADGWLSGPREVLAGWDAERPVDLDDDDRERS